MCRSWWRQLFGIGTRPRYCERGSPTRTHTPTQKKKKSGGGAGSPVAAAVASGADEAGSSGGEKGGSAVDDAALAAGLDQLRHGGLWVALAGAGVTDKRLKVLCDSLRGSSVTSLDLSGNRISDTGASSLAAALGAATVAPDLISLNLAGNPLTDVGRAALQSLAKARKGLDVRLTAVEVVAPLVQTQGAPLLRRPVGGPGGGGRGAGRAGGLRSALMSRYFNEGHPQVQHHQQQADNSPASVPDTPPHERRPSPLEAAHVALSAASTAVAVGGDGEWAPHALCDALMGGVLAVDTEMSEWMDTYGALDDGTGGLQPGVPWWQQQQTTGAGPAGSPPLFFPRIASMPPATQTLAQGAEVVVAVLQLVPEARPWQAAPKGATGEAALRPGYGTHRVAALRLLLRLLRLRCAELDEVLAGCGACVHATRVLLTCTCSSPGTMTAAQVLDAALRSPHAALWTPVLEPDTGLVAHIVAECTASAGLAPGLRAPHIGALTYLGTSLACVSANQAEWVTQHHGPLVEALQGSEVWGGFVDGALRVLQQQAQGVLCGPRPVRASVFGHMGGLNPLGLGPEGDDAGDDASAGGGPFSAGLSTLMSGRDLLTMLQSFGRLTMGTGAKANGPR